MTRPLFIKFLLIPLVMTYFTLLERSAVAIEEVPYILIEQDGEFSLREYPPHIVAETTVDGSFDHVGSEGFRRLVAYINGENRKKQSIAMTAPVKQEAQAENIAMTAPVKQEKIGDSWRITFVMPAKYALDALPEPIDSRVSISTGTQTPDCRCALFRYLEPQALYKTREAVAGMDQKSGLKADLRTGVGKIQPAIHALVSAA